MEKIQQTRKAWASEAIKMYQQYLPAQISDLHRQVASIFFYVCAIAPEKEAETVCELLAKAWEEPSEQRVQKAAELLSNHYCKQITKSVEFYLPNLFAPMGTRNFAMRQCANHVLEYCRRKMKKPISQTEWDEYETRCRHLIYVRERIKQADATANKMQKDWEDTHIFSTTIRFRKDQINRLEDFLKDENPQNSPDCGKILESFTFKDGAILLFSLECTVNDESKQNVPVLVVKLNKGTTVVQKTFLSIKTRRVEKIEAGDCTYHFMLSLYEHPYFAYDKAKQNRDRMKLGYPRNLISEILDITSSETPSDFMDVELETALAELDERKRMFILLRYQEGKTYREIGELYHLTPQRVRDVINYGIRCLRTIRLRQVLRGETIVHSQVIQEMENNEISVEDCKFSTRLLNCLKREGICTLKELQNKSWTDLFSIRNFGAGCRRELEKYCETHQIMLKE